ncbi:MAG: OadG family protein [Clostridia bacterium]|nr:OadG family protein [Clostridia bacterium]
MNMAYNLTNAALSVNADGTYVPFSVEAWKYAGEMTLLGMGMIFAVLALLWLVLAVFKLIFVGKAPKKEKTKAPEAVAKAVQESVVAVEEDTVPVAEAGDDELVAVITAAVATYMAEENGGVPVGGFRVVSFRRACGGRPWNAK